MSLAFIALGSNVGNRAAHMELAVRELSRLPHSRLVAASKFIETDPVGMAEPDRFLNGAAALETTLAPEALLAELLRIEKLAGRERHRRWAPRTLDLDLLMYDDRVMQTEELTLPHPRMHERRFVLEPLAEIAPGSVHPVLKKTIGELLRELRES
jgi:2-amino-4-hydroxy-6-hydroxymethyldihydropteridine diphosphokinase